MSFLLTAELNFRASATALTQVRSQIQNGLSGIKAQVDLAVSPRAQAELASLARGSSAASSALRNVDVEATRAGSAIERYGQKVSLALSRYSAFLVGTSGLVAGLAAARRGIKEALNFDDQLVRLAAVADDGKSAVAGVRAEITRLGTSLGVSQRELAGVAVTLSQAGNSARDIKKALEGLALSSLSPSFGSLNKTVEGAISLMAQFGVKADELKGKLGGIAAVASGWAVESEDLVTAIQKVGGSFSAAGGQVEELLGLVTSVRATTRESISEISTGLRTILQRSQRSETVDQLRELGIELRHTRAEAEALGDIGLENQFVKPFEAIRRISAGLKNVSPTDPRFTTAIESLGGYRQISRAIPLVQQFPLAQRARAAAKVGAAALEAQAAQRANSLQVQLSKVGETWKSVANDLVQSTGFRSFVQLLGDGAIAAAELTKQLGPLVPVVGAIAAVKIGSVATQFGAGLLTSSAFRVPRRAQGGALDGGIPGVDSIPILAQSGEFILRKEAVQGIGRGAVDFMNRTGRLPRYAGGGPVGDIGPLSAARTKLDKLFGGRSEEVLGRILATLNRDLARTQGRIERGDPLGSFGRAVRTLGGEEGAYDAMLYGALTGIQKFEPGRSYLAKTDRLAEALQIYARRGAWQKVRDRARIGSLHLDSAAIQAAARPLAASSGTSVLRAAVALIQQQHAAGRTPQELAAQYNTRVDKVERAIRGDIGPRPVQTGRDLDTLAAPTPLSPAGQGLDEVLRVLGVKSLPSDLGGYQKLAAALGISGSFNLKSDDLINAIAGVARSRLSGSSPPASPPPPPPPPERRGGYRPPREATSEAELALKAMGIPVGTTSLHARARRLGIPSPHRIPPAELASRILAEYRAGKSADLDVNAATLSGESIRTAFLGGGLNEQSLGRLFPGGVPTDYVGLHRALSGLGVKTGRVSSEQMLQMILAAAKAKGFSGGGLVPGPAGDWTDSQFATVKPGSYVIKKTSVRKAGPERLAALAGGSRYASGGEVGVRLMPGEWVYGPEQADRIGRATLEQVNATGRIPGYADGGLVYQYTGVDRTGKKVSGKLTAKSAEEAARQVQQQGILLTVKPFLDRVALHQDQMVAAAHAVQEAQRQQELTEARAAARRVGAYPSPELYAALGGAPAPADPLVLRALLRSRGLSYGDETKIPGTAAASVRPPYTPPPVGGSAAPGVMGEVYRRYREQRDAAGLTPLANTAGTREALRQQAEAGVRKELESAVRRQVGRLGVSKEVSDQVAREYVDRALATNAGIIRGTSGNLLGLDSLGQQLAARGIDPTGRSRYQRAVDRLDQYGSLGRTAAGAGRGLGWLGEKIRANGGVSTGIGLSIALPYAAEVFAPEKGAAELAARTGDEGAYRRGAATAGALQFAGVGAAAGLAFGPWGAGIGAGIGAAVGALYGFTSSLRQASRDIGEAKLSNAVQRLAESFRDVASGKRDLGSVNSREALADIRDARLSAEARARDLTTGFFGSKIDQQKEARERAQYLADLAVGKQVEAPKSGLAEARAKTLKEALGNSAPSFAAALSNEAGALGRGSPLAKPEELAGRLSQGLSGELVRVLAELRRVSPAQVLRELTTTIRESQANVIAERASTEGRRAADRSANAAGRLAEAMDAAANSTQTFKAGLDVSALAFGGSVPRLGGLSQGLAALGAVNNGPYQRSLSIITGALGASGGAFAERTRAADSVQRVLADVLTEVASQGFDEKETTSTKVRKRLEEALLPGVPEANRLQALKAQPHLADALRVVVGGVSELDADKPGEALKLFRNDSVSAAKRLNAPNVETSQEVAVRIARRIEDQANLYADALTQSRAHLVQIGDEQDKVAEIRLAALRAQAEVRSEQLGGGEAGRFLSYADLAAPFESRQRRLLAGTGLGNEDVAGIAARLAEKQAEQRAAYQAQGAAVGTPGYTEAAQTFSRVSTEVSNLTRALQNLARPTEKLSAVNERLAVLNGDRNSRLSYAERVVSAGPEERLRLVRGQRLAAAYYAGQTTFGGLSDDDRRLALEAAHHVGRARFPNGKTGEGLAVKMLSELGVLKPGEEQERTGLIGEAARLTGQAGTAQSTLAASLAGSNQTFLKDLEILQGRFLAELKAELAGNRVTETQAAIGSNRGQHGELVREQAQAAILARAGITNQAQLEKARPLAQELREFYRIRQEIADLSGAGGDDTRKKVEGKAAEQVDSVLQNLDLQSLLRGGGLGNQSKLEKNARQYEASSGFSRFLTDVATGAAPGVRLDVHGKNLETLRKRDEAIRGIVSGSGALDQVPEALRGAVQDEVTRGFRERFEAKLGQVGGDRRAASIQALSELTGEALGRHRDEYLGTLRARSDVIGGGLLRGGVDPNRVGDARERERLAELLENGFQSSTGRTLENLPKRVRSNEQEFERHTQALKDNRAELERRLTALGPTSGERASASAAIAGGVLYRAGGGGVGGPRGTDTVPAWLTESEFVVRASQAKANRGLLERINNANGPVHLADGGEVLREGMSYYEAARRHISSGLRWLGFARGGPVYLAGGGYSQYVAGNTVIGPNYTPTPPPDEQAKIAEAVRRHQAYLARQRAAERIAPAPRESPREAARAAAAAADPFGGAGLAELAKKSDEEKLVAAYKRQASSLVLQQAYAGASLFPGDEDVYLGSVDRLRSQEARDQSRFRNQFGDVAGRVRLQNAAKQLGSILGRVRAEGRRKDPGPPGYGSGYSRIGPDYKHPKPVAPAPRAVDDILRFPFGPPDLGVFALPSHFATGGLVSAGVQGRDSVPALLAKNEYVLPADVVQNKGVAAVKRFAQGGLVGGDTGGGVGSAGDGRSDALAKAFASFGTTGESLASAMRTWVPAAEQLTKALQQMPREVQMSGRQEVVLVGTEAVSDKLTAAVKEMIEAKTAEILAKVAAAHSEAMPGAPRLKLAN